MAIFNEEYTSAAQEAYDFYTSDDDQSVNEAVGADDIIIATIIASAVSIVVGSISLWVANRATIKAALAKYPKIHEDCKPLKSFTKKIHKVFPFLIISDRPSWIIWIISPVYSHFHELFGRP